MKKTAPIRTRPFGWMTDIIFPAIEREPRRLAVWLAATRPEWHFAAMAFALLDDEERNADVEAMLFVRTKKEILADVAPSADPRLIRLCDKLKGRIWRPPTYRRLAELVEDKEAARLLLRTRSIDRRRVLALARVPATFRCPAVFARLHRISDAEKVVFAVGLVERIRPDLGRAGVLRSLAQTRSKTSLEAWARGHFREASFPDPPWPGTAKLKPLASWQAVEKTAIRFRNCIRDYVREVRSGSHYLYLFEDGDGLTAVVEFVRVTDGLWVVDEINGPDNKPLSPAQEARVVAEASEVALAVPAGSRGVHVWTDPSYW
ncbi:hypothetical protein [Parvularcula lutaonensis]|uniref:PcfJ-like protein n=1 Tax=Parvularcula lutaonensis TaxID=491923 RepID=A0ABV7MCS7_9PROT|nr:hypothetical protein [Parvularcula lutaonensis]GGY50944.1 hypothetical protein GCM10007148_19720 [Parvularcula lutaonensis]